MDRMVRTAVLALVSGTATLFAQGGPPPGGPGGRGAGFGPMGGMGLGHGKVVTGAPYSADVSNQMTQTLADGNTISRSNTGHVARDSQGRTYSQETFAGGFLGSTAPVTVTFIVDPVTGYAYALHSDKKTAVRRAIRQPQDGFDPLRRPHDRADRPTPPDVVTTDLGMQNINGVQATGKSTTRTVPAGAMGNSQPLVSTNETWYSPDLQTFVLAKRNDPRMGQSTFTLTNIQRNEPTASLFQVPADYTVTDAKGGPGGFRPGGPPPAAPPEP